MRPSDAGPLARERIDVPWDDLRAARVQRAVLADLRAGRPAARPPLRRLFVALAACLTLAAILIGYVKPWRAGAPGPSRVDFADGSVALPDRGALVIPIRVSAERIEVEQARGSASYDVVHHPDRPFVVRAGAVSIEVLGTAFSVERHAGVVRVLVERGRVKVSRGERTMVLGPREEISLAESDPGATPGSEPPTPAPIATGAGGGPEPLAPARPGGGLEPGVPEPPTPASSGGLDPLLPGPAGSPAPALEAPTAAELFRQADDARARGDTAGALRLLRELVQRYPRDGRATMGLFTIGRLERRRGHAADAARAFEACGGALSGEATAEAALAWVAAGDRARAELLAGRYLAARPRGPRAEEMARLAR